MALINKLTAIADAIREKTGTTNEMTLDEMATAIANISSGGDGKVHEFETTDGTTLLVEVDTWNFNGTSSTSVLNHNLGVTPTFVLVCPASSITTAYSSVVVLNTSNLNLVGYRTQSSTSYAIAQGTYVTSKNATSVTIKTYSSSYPFRAGKYYFIAIARKS